MTLDGRDITSLKGWGLGFLSVLKVHVKLHHGVKVLELLAVNQDSALMEPKDESVIHSSKKWIFMVSSKGGALY
jgi:hypothetical protein